MTTFEQVRDTVLSSLPRKVDALELEFYGEEVRQADEYVAIGRDTGTEFRVDLASGNVFAVTTSGSSLRWFVNSGLQEFAACLEVHERTRELGADCEDDDHKWHAALHIMLADVGRVDAAATAAAGNWWPMLAESLMI